MHVLFIYCYGSIKHQLDDKWDGVNTRLSTCDPHANKLVTSSDSPQEVEAGKEIIFTYDVHFEVLVLHVLFGFCFPLHVIVAYSLNVKFIAMISIESFSLIAGE